MKENKEKVNIVRRIAKNTGFLILAEVVNKVLALLLVIYLARELGSEIFGFYSFIVAFVTLFSLFADFGLDTLFVRDVAKDKKLMNHYFSNIFGMKILLSIFSYFLVICIASFIGYPDQVINLLMILSVTLILDTFANQYISVFRALEDMKYISYAQIAQNIFKIFSSIGIILAGYGLTGLMSVFVAASLLKLVILIRFTNKKKILKLRIKFDFHEWEELIKNSYPFALLSIFVIIYFRIDTIMLERMTNLNVVGWYNAAYSILVLLIHLPQIFTGVIFPTMSSLEISSKPKLREVYTQSFRFLVVFGVLFSMGGILLAKPIIRLLYGAAYTPAVFPLQILLFTLLPLFISSLTSNVINIYRPKTNLLIAAIIMLPMNIILNLILIPIYSLSGAAIATLITESSGALLSIYFAGHYLGKVRVRVTILLYRPLISAFIMGIVITYTMSLWLLPIYALIYFGALYLLGEVSPLDKEIFAKILNKKTPKEVL